jgi:hypothetical protein
MPIPLFLTIALAVAGALASPAVQAAPAADAVVQLRHFEVPAPARGRMTLNTAQVFTPRAAPPQAGAAREPSATPAQVPSTPAAALTLEQPGLAPAAREEARKNGVPVLAASTSVPAIPEIPPAAAPGAVTPPPPVFQTMQQAAQARATPAASLPPASEPAAAPALSWFEQALAWLRTHLPSAAASVPRVAAALGLLAFIVWRRRAARGNGPAAQ